MNKFYEFMRGRYGADELSAIIVLVSFVLLLVLSITDVWWLLILPLALVFYAVYRILSKDISARKKENEYIFAIKDVFNKKPLKKEKQNDQKEYVYAKCPSCNANLRLPKGKGEFSIACPSCKKRMRVRS